MAPVFEHIGRGTKTLVEGRKMLTKIAIAAVVVILIAMMFPRGDSIEYSYKAGTVWTNNDLVAPFSFPIYKDDRVYEQERQEAARAVLPVFVRNELIERTQSALLQTIWKQLRTAAEARRRMLKSHSGDDSLAFRQAATGLPLTLSGDDWRAVTSVAQRPQEFEQQVIAILGELWQKGVLNQSPLKQTDTVIAIRKGRIETVVTTAGVCTSSEALAAAEERISKTFTDNNTKIVGNLLARAVLRPNLFFDEHATSQAARIAAENVPQTIGYVLERETIIRKNEPITEEAKLKLDSFERMKIDRSSLHNSWQHWIGVGLHVMLLIGIFGVYLFLFRKRVFHDNSRLVIIALLVLMETLFAYLSLQVDLTEPVQYLIFVPAASMLLTIIFDSRVGFYGTVTIAFLVAAIRGNDYNIALISLIAGSLGAYTVRDIRLRTQIFRSLVFIFLGYSLSILALSIERFESLTTTLAALTFASVNAVISPVLTYGLLLLFERIFKVTTDLTLQELSNIHHPLLQELSEKAPGTFHHSITLGSLAESAAEAVGANPILARVGAYYHDIGKMLKPEYFVENQAGMPNRHNRLKPRMSALIIASHVKEGMELGRSRGLPEAVLNFIPQHHGTTRMSFFYDKALKQALKRPPKDTINETDFRYPGPKPQTKEAGIVMLADSVEATTRAITEITPQKLELTIDSVIKKRFLEGQLDECPLTLRDLANIREAFLKILVGVHHQRIKYPEQTIDVPPSGQGAVPEHPPEEQSRLPEAQSGTQASYDPGSDLQPPEAADESGGADAGEEEEPGGQQGS